MSNDKTVAALHTALADSYALYLKAQNFHWHVRGPRFLSLHQFFEEIYTDLQTAIDTTAERILALGSRAPASFEDYARLSGLKTTSKATQAQQMVEELASDHTAIIASWDAVAAAAADRGDRVSEDLSVQRMAVHEKNRWMLDALMDSSA